MTFDEFVSCLAPLVQICPDEFDAKTAGVYFEILKDLPCDALQAAVLRHLHESQIRWMPAPGHLRRLAFELFAPPLLTAAEAFGHVQSAVHVFGVYRQSDAMQELDEPTRKAIRCIGGWRDFCDNPPELRGVLHSQFVAAYNGIVERIKLQRLPEALRPRLPQRTEMIAFKPSRFIEIAPTLQRSFEASQEAPVTLSRDENEKRRAESVKRLQRVATLNGWERSGCPP